MARPHTMELLIAGGVTAALVMEMRARGLTEEDAFEALETTYKGVDKVSPVVPARFK